MQYSFAATIVARAAAWRSSYSRGASHGGYSSLTVSTTIATPRASTTPPVAARANAPSRALRAS
eukprot:8743651-Pyramimonas_sp.AAC.1